jgi:hypothetical protein
MRATRLAVPGLEVGVELAEGDLGRRISVTNPLGSHEHRREHGEIEGLGSFDFPGELNRSGEDEIIGREHVDSAPLTERLHSRWRIGELDPSPMNARIGSASSRG